MARRRTVAALAVVALLATAATGYRVADPGAGPTVESLDTEGPPAQVAAAGLAQVERRDVTVRWLEDCEASSVVRDGTPTCWLATLRLDHGDRQLSAVVNDSFASGVETYVGEHCRWTRHDASQPWTGDCGPTEGWATLHDPKIFHEEELRNDSAVAVVRESPSRLVLRVTDTAAAHRVVTGAAPLDGENLTANLTLHVDRDAGHLDRAVYRLVERSDDGTRRRRAEFVFERWDATDVRRPAGAGYSLLEFLFDVFDAEEW